MKLRLLISAFLVGGAYVQVPGDNGGKRTYPQGLALILGLVGGIGVGTSLHGSGPKQT